MRLVCPRCANSIEVANREAAVCPVCGYSADPTARVPSKATPVYSVAAPTAPAAAGAVRKTNGWAVTSMVLGIVAVPIGWMTMGLLPLLAVIFGIVALTQIKRTGDGGRGMAITGIVLGGFVLLVALFLAIVFGLLFFG